MTTARNKGLGYPRWRKVLSDVWTFPLRTVLVVLSVAAGVFVVGVTETARITFTRDLSRLYADTVPAHAVISTGIVGNDILKMIRSVPGVADAQGRNTASVFVQDASGKWRGLQLRSLPDFNDIRISKIYPYKGSWPPGRGELLLERGSLEYLGLRPGDTIRIRLDSKRHRDLPIVGIAHDLGEPVATMTNQVCAFVTLETMRWLGFSWGYNSLLLRMTPESARSREGVRDVAKEVTKKISSAGYRVGGTYMPEPDTYPLDEILDPLILLLSLLGSLSLVLSGFLVINTVSAVITHQTRQIGIMKALGATRCQIMGMYFCLVAIFSVLALAVGIPLGALGGRAIGRYMGRMLNFDVVGFGLPGRVVLLQIAVGFLAPASAAFLPIWAGSNVTVHDALNSRGIDPGGSGLLGGRFQVQIRTWSTPKILAVRNTFRRKGRFAFTLITLGLAGAVFVAVLSVRASLYRTMDDHMRYSDYDIQVDFERIYRIQLLKDSAVQLPGVAHAESWGYYTARRLYSDGTQSDSMRLLGLPIPTQMLQPFVVEGRWLLPTDENAIVISSDVLKKEPDLKPGSVVTLLVGERELTWRVVGIVRGVLSGRRAYANYAYVARATRNLGRASRLLIKTTNASPSSDEALAERLEHHFKENGLRVRSMYLKAEEQRLISSQLDILCVFLLSVALLLALVGGLGLMGTMSINVLERTREIGVMRAVGASDSAVASIFLVEGMLIGLMSWLLGSVLSWPASRALSKVVGDVTFRAPLSFTFSWLGVGAWLVIATTLAALATLVPALRAAKTTVRDVLAYE